MVLGDDRLLDNERDLIARARAFAEREIAPNAAQWEHERRVPLETVRSAAAEGLAGLMVPKERGGQGLSFTATARVLEELCRYDMALAFGLVVHNNFARAIALTGTEDQIERYLPSLIAGERIGAFGLTEPSTGSDAAAIVTRAERAGEGWRIDGEKAWVTNGAVADLVNLFAQTDPAQSARGIAAFIVEAAWPGVERLPAYAMMGGHATGTAGMRFAGVEVPEANVLCPPGQGFRAAMVGIDFARVFVAAMCCGMLRNAIDTAVGYARERTAFGRPIGDNQGLRWMLADAETDYQAARLLTFRAAALLDEGAAVAVPAAHAKKFATRVALARLSDCMQAMGAVGYRQDWPFARHLAGAKMAQFLDGTTEIQNLVIARDLMRA